MMALGIGSCGQGCSKNQGTSSIKLDLVWEKEIQQGTTEIVFLDDSGYNIFSSQCANLEKALREKMMLITTKNAVTLCSSDSCVVIRETELSPHSKVAISKNGRNFAVLEHIISGNVELGQWHLNVKKSIVQLFDWQHEELARVELAPIPYAQIHAMGNNNTVVLSDAGEDGYYTNVIVLRKRGGILESSVELTEGLYPTGVYDYAENGSCMFVIYNGTRIVLDGTGKELARYDYQHSGWMGYVSPLGNYIAEVTRGKYVVLRNKAGRLIGEHPAQGMGNYFAAFSSDEKFLCVSPGPWCIYLFKTEDGELIWTYRDTDKQSHFSSLAVISSAPAVFAGRSEAIVEPGEFKGSADELNKKVIENATKDRVLYIVGKSQLLAKHGPFPGTGFGTQLQAPQVYMSVDQKFLLVKTPTKIYIYSISVKGE